MTDEEPSSDIDIGSGSIVFKETKNGHPLILAKGPDAQIGETIGIHPLDVVENKEYVSHGINYFKIGDGVIIRELATGEEAAFKPGWEYFGECENIPVGVHDLTKRNIDKDPECPEGIAQNIWYREYEFFLSKPIERLEDSVIFPRTNLNIGLAPAFNDDAFQSFWPYGAVWIGVSEDGDSYYWCGSTDPHLILSADPMFSLSPEDTQYCQVNWLNACGSPSDCCPPPLSIQAVNYIKIHIRHQSSLMWYGYNKADIGHIVICVGQEGEHWCMYTPDRGIRDMLDDEID